MHQRQLTHNGMSVSKSVENLWGRDPSISANTTVVSPPHWCRWSNLIARFLVPTHPRENKYHLSFLELTFGMVTPHNSTISPRFFNDHLSFMHVFFGFATSTIFQDRFFLLSALALRQAPGVKAQAHRTTNPGDLGAPMQRWCGKNAQIANSIRIRLEFYVCKYGTCTLHQAFSHNKRIWQKQAYG